MADDKAFAPLTSALLARKGAARPAMRPQLPPADDTRPLDDLGWNDWGGDAGVPEVRRQQAEIAREFAPSVAAITAEAGRRSAFTLRLDAARHLRLRLACAVEHRSAQQIVTAALDAFIASMPEIERLAADVPAATPAAMPAE